MRSHLSKLKKIERQIQLLSPQKKSIASEAKSWEWRNSPPILLPYQARWNADKSSVKIIEKSRRIGISWADAAQSALDAASKNGCDTHYIGYNKDMTETYIADVGYWAKAYNLAAQSFEKEIIEEDGKSINVFRVRFKSGYKVVALSSKPTNLRSIKGKIIIDEAAFHDDLDELLKAALAIVMWGGQVRIISTHNGEENPFNLLVQAIKRKEKNYSLHKVPFQDAIAQGFYERICLTLNIPVTSKGKEEWIREIHDIYGVTASEELDCIPLALKGGGKLIKKEWLKIVSHVPRHRYCVSFWDMAATAREINQDAFYTARSKGFREGNDYFILDARAKQLAPADGDQWILKTAQEDGRDCHVRWELEGGSAGPKVEAYLKSLLWNYDAEGIKPQGDKVARFIPFASEAKRGNVYLQKGHWNEQYINSLFRFDGTPIPKVSDFADTASGLWEALQRVQDTLFEAWKRQKQLNQ